MSAVFLLLAVIGLAWVVKKLKGSAEVASVQLDAIHKSVPFDLNFKRMGFEVSISTSASKILIKRPFVNPLVFGMADVRSCSTEWVDKSTPFGIQQSNFKVILLLRSIENPRIEIPVPNKNVAAQLTEMVQQGRERSGGTFAA